MDSSILSKLLTKLQLENSRSYYLNALPGRAYSKIDVSNLDFGLNLNSSDLFQRLINESSFRHPVKQLIDDLEDEELEEAFALKENNKRKLKRLFLNIKDLKSERGLDPLYFGFPIFIRKDPSQDSKTIAAPLFLWKISLEHSRNYSNWFISRNEDESILTNTALQLFLQGEGDKTLNYDNFIDEDADQIDLGSLVDFLNHICDEFNIDINASSEIKRVSESGFDKLPISKKDLKKSSNTVSYDLHFGGILGAFKSSKGAIIKDFQEYLEDGMEIPCEEFEVENFSGVDLDPSQLKTIENLNSNKNLVIHGPPGTGKSQVLTGLVTSALIKKKKILVVCEKVTALNIIKENLKNCKYENQVALITDVTRDRKTIVQTARELEENCIYSKAEKNFDTIGLNQLHRIHEMHMISRDKNYFLNKNYTSSIGRFLKLKKELSIIELTGDYTFSEDFLGKINRLEKANKPLPNIYDFTAPFNLENEIDLISLKEKLTTVKDLVIKLNDEHIKFRKEKTAVLIASCQDRIKSYQKTIELIGPIVHEFKNRLAPKLRKFLYGNSLIKFFSELFDTEYKEFLRKYDVYKQSFELIEHLVDSIPSNEDEIIKSLPVLISRKEFEEAQIEELEGDDKWVECLKDKEVQKEYEQLLESSKSRLREYRILTDNFISTSLEKPFESTEKLNLVLKNFSDFNEVLELIKKLQDIGIDYQSQDFKKVYELDNWSNYFEYHALKEVLRTAGENIYISDTTILEIQEKLNQYKSFIRRDISVRSQNRLVKSITQFAQNNGTRFKRLFNLRGGKGKRRTSLRRITNDYTDLFTEVFPVILTTPSSASTLFKGTRQYFDLVIFDEASQINLEDALPAIMKGKRIIVAGDQHQMPPSNLFARKIEFEETEEMSEEDYDNLDIVESESLLDFAISEQTFASSYLDFHYRSRNHALIDFSNNAFYKRLIPTPQNADYTPIEYIGVYGAYKDRMNEKEADKVVDIIQKIDTSQKTPSIGIATLNLTQRNLIFEKLTSLANDDEDFAIKLEELEAEGLFIKNLENIQGDERDIIIISTTFGKDVNGSFRQQFGPINTGVGHRLLNVLITRAKEKLFVVTSIPDRFINTYSSEIETKGNRGKGLFYAYLAYANAVSNRNKESTQHILSQLSKNIQGPKSFDDESQNLLESPFEEEVYSWLLNDFSDEELKIQEKDSGFRIDIVLRPKNTPDLKIAIECDGATYHSDYDSYHYDLHRQKILENSGYKFIRIWSKNWFLDSKSAYNRMLRDINDKIEKHRSTGNILPQYLLENLYEIEEDFTENQIDIFEKHENEIVQIDGISKGDIVYLEETHTGKEMTFKLTHDNDLKNRHLSIYSPLGERLIGKQIDDKIFYNDFEYHIKKFESLNNGE